MGVSWRPHSSASSLGSCSVRLGHTSHVHPRHIFDIEFKRRLHAKVNFVPIVDTLRKFAGTAHYRPHILHEDEEIMTEAKDFVNLPPEDIVDSEQPDIVKVDLDPGSCAEASSTATMVTDFVAAT